MSALHLQSAASLSSSQRAIVASLQEPLAFDALYREHFRFVWTSLLRLGVPRHGVEDALQETFLVVHRRLDDFEGRGSPRAWLFGILRRVAFRSRRTRDRTQRKVSALAHERPGTASLDDEVARRQLSALLLDALDELDDDKRAALTLHVFEELSGPEVAGLLGLKVDTAYSRIKAGRKALQRVLATKGVDADVARLVQATRADTEPAPGTRKRVAALLGAAPLGTGGATIPAAWPLLASPKVLLVVGALGAASVFGVAQLSRSETPSDPPHGASNSAAPHALSDHEPAASPTAAAMPPAAPLHVDPTPRTDPAPAITPAPRARAVTGATAPELPPAAEANETVTAALRAEVELIGRATSALRNNRPDEALAALDEHATTFPRGQLATERRAYRAIALCAAGNTRQGRAEARLLLKSAPPKALRARVETACGVTSVAG